MSEIIFASDIHTEPPTLEVKALPDDNYLSPDILSSMRYLPPLPGYIDTRSIPEELKGHHVIVYADLEQPIKLKEYMLELKCTMSGLDRHTLFRVDYLEGIRKYLLDLEQLLNCNSYNERAALTEMYKRHENIHRLNNVRFHTYELFFTETSENPLNYEDVKQGRFYDEVLAMCENLKLTGSENDTLVVAEFLREYYDFIPELFQESTGRLSLFDAIKKDRYFDPHAFGFLAIVTGDLYIIDHIKNFALDFTQFNDLLDSRFRDLFNNPTKFLEDTNISEMKKEIYMALVKEVDCRKRALAVPSDN
jgi:hypothetical protein